MTSPALASTRSASVAAGAATASGTAATSGPGSRRPAPMASTPRNSSAAAPEIIATRSARRTAASPRAKCEVMLSATVTDEVIGIES